jgi:hypothetical protein
VSGIGSLTPGKLPRGVERIDAPTPYVWIIGRTQTNGVKDYETVHKFQDGYKITSLADWGKTPRKIKQKIDPSVDTKTEPLRQVNAMQALQYFKYGAELMKQNPPHGTDWSINPLNRFAIGDRDALKFNNDGSLDLYIQNENPGPDKESNWLPASKSGKLGLTLRLYAPKPQVADGRWNPPAIKRVN